MTTNLVITNLALRGENLSLSGGEKGSGNINLRPTQVALVPVRDVQFDPLWLETLATYVARLKAQVVLDGYTLSPDEIRELKHTDINEVLGQYLESKERGIVTASLGHGRYYSGLDGHPHYRAGNGADFDLTAGGTYIDQVTHRIYVDGGRTDVYVESGSVGRPFKTIQAAVNASVPGDCLCIASALYRENVVMIGNRHIDADPGALLEPLAGDALTIISDMVGPWMFGICFIRGLTLSAISLGAWALKVDGSTGAWPPFAVVLDNIVNCTNKANGVSALQGGVYFTDAGGMNGDPDSPVIAIRGENAQVIAGSFNWNVGTNGFAIDLYDNGFFLGDKSSFSTNGPGATLVRLTPGPLAGANAEFVNCQMDAGGSTAWKTLVRSTSQNVGVRFIGRYNNSWGQCSDDCFNMAGGGLELHDGQWSSDGGRGIVMDEAATGYSWSVMLQRAGIQANDKLAVELHGNGNFEEIDCPIRNRGTLLGTVSIDMPGRQATFSGGDVSGPNTGIDLINGNLWLTGGVDLVPYGGAFVPYNIHAGCGLFKGHCNIRFGSLAPIMAGGEMVLPSGFAELLVGATGEVIRFRSWLNPFLPGGGAGFYPGSVIVWLNDPLGINAYVNTGTEVAPVWARMSTTYTPTVPANWVGPAPTDLVTAIDRVANALATHLGVPIP